MALLHATYCREPAVSDVPFGFIVSGKRGSRPRRLKPRLNRFLDCYTDPKSDAFGIGAKACERAGYKGKRASLAVQASRLLRNNVDIQEAIGRELLKRGCTPGFIADRIMDAMHAVVIRVVTTATGKSLVFKDPNYQIILKAVELAVRFQSNRHHGNKSGRGMKGGEVLWNRKKLPTNETEVGADSSPETLHLSASEKIKSALELIAKDESLRTDEIRARLLRILEAGGDHNDASNDRA